MQPMHAEQREGFLRTVAERHRGTMIEALGYRLVDVARGWVQAEIPFRPDLSQITGVFHAGALMGLADTSATWASLTLLCNERGDLRGRMSYTVQASANLVGNVSSGVARAEARVVHPGRSTHVVQTRITNEDGKPLFLLTTTHFLA